jgi:fatty acid desaturase
MVADAPPDVFSARDGAAAAARARAAPFPEQAKGLSAIDARRSVGILLLQWGIIVGVVALAMHAGGGWVHWLVGVFAIVVVASRQQALAALMHEAAHYRLFASRALNDAVSDFFCALPLGLVTSRYRTTHLLHHVEPLGANDPDWTTMQAHPREWGWPKTARARDISLLRDAVGLGMLAFTQQWKVWLPQTNFFGRDSAPEPFARDTKLRICIFYAGVLLLAFGFGLWREILLYWLLPLATVGQVFFHIRTISEHMGCGPGAGMGFTRNVMGTVVERLLISPLNVGHHLTHHIFPGVPWYNLPRLTKLLQEDAQFSGVAYISPSYLGRDGVLRAELTRPG